MIFRSIDHNGPARFIGRIPRGGSIVVPGNIRGSTTDSENNLLAKCGDLTVRIVWNAVESRSAVSRHNELIVYQLKDDDRAGTDFGICHLCNAETNEESDNYFRLVIQSGNCSFVSGIPGKEFTCFGCLPIEVSATGEWFGISGFQKS
jgi:hypothetical protein